MAKLTSFSLAWRSNPRREWVDELDLQTRVPDVPAEQKAFDQAHKHLCKLRWIGQDVDSEYVFTVLRAAGLASRPRVKPRLRPLPALQVQDLQTQNLQAQDV